MNEAETKYKDEVLIKMYKAAYYESKKDEQKPGKYFNSFCALLKYFTDRPRNSPTFYI